MEVARTTTAAPEPKGKRRFSKGWKPNGSRHTEAAEELQALQSNRGEGLNKIGGSLNRLCRRQEKESSKW